MDAPARLQTDLRFPASQLVQTVLLTKSPSCPGDCDNAYYLLHLRDTLGYAPIRPFPFGHRLLHASYALQEGSDARKGGSGSNPSSYIWEVADQARGQLPYVTCDGKFAPVSR